MGRSHAENPPGLLRNSAGDGRTSALATLPCGRSRSLATKLPCVTSDPVDKKAALNALNFGARVAEDEREGLADYFVETDQWRKVISGEVDVVFGTKGAGKSAIYTSLMNRADELAKRKIHLTSAEKPRGSTVFQGLITDPPTTEIEFVSIWKLYVLSLLGTIIVDQRMVGPDADAVKSALFDEGLLDGSDAPLQARLRRVWDWIKSTVGRSTPESSVELDPATGQPVGLTFKISLQEPSSDERSRGYRSLDDLLRTANAALDFNDGRQVWVLFDRLDVAFADSHALEANGIRALFKAYLDMLELDNIGIKIFLRTDIWAAITADGFREASHITRQLRIEWGSASMLNLIVRRALRLDEVVNYYGVDPASVLADAAAQRAFFDGIVPDQVDVGRNPPTFDWILGRVQDGTRRPAPREVIHLLNEARDAQARMEERGDQPPPGSELLSRASFRESLGPVSFVRLEQTLYAEFPASKPWIQELEGEKTEHTPESLADIWGVDESEAIERAQRLVDIGFMEQRGDRSAIRYWIPFLYRPALKLRQGSAD